MRPTSVANPLPAFAFLPTVRSRLKRASFNPIPARGPPVCARPFASRR